MIKIKPLPGVVFSIELAFLLFMLPAFAADEDPKNIAGYGKTAWGMSEDEVVQAESPLAKKLDKPVITARGDIRGVTIDEIKIASTPFRAQFVFDSKERKLKQVTLEGPSSASEATFSDIEKLLTEKYGVPTNKEEGIPSPITNKVQGKRSSWRLTKTTIDLTLIADGLLFVSYTPFGVDSMIEHFKRSEHDPYLKRGNASVGGQAFLQQAGGGIVTCAGNEVRLMPDTTYFQEVMAGVRRGEGIPKDMMPGIRKDMMPSQYFDIAKMSRCDAQGNFYFANLTAGKWIVLTSVTWRIPGRYDSEGGIIAAIVPLSENESARVVLTGANLIRKARP